MENPHQVIELQESGALILPSERVLQDYKNYFKPKAGISKESVESLHVKTSSFTPVQRYIAVVVDEMKIQSNLVFDKVSGDLIGFIDLDNPMTNFANLTDEDPIANLIPRVTFLCSFPHLKETLVSAGHVTLQILCALGGDSQSQLATRDVSVLLTRRHYEE